MRDLIEKIKSWLNSIFKKEEQQLLEKAEESDNTVQIETKQEVEKENILKKQRFIENTYEIDSLKYKLEKGSVDIETIPYEKKMELISSYTSEIELLEAQIKLITKK